MAPLVPSPSNTPAACQQIAGEVVGGLPALHRACGSELGHRHGGSWSPYQSREGRVGNPDVARDLERYLRERGTSRDPDAPLFPTRTGDQYTIEGFGKLIERIRTRSEPRDFSANLLRHTWATNFMRVPGASLLELKRQGGRQRWEQVERHSHAVPVQDRRAMPNPLQKTALASSLPRGSAAFRR
jgi:hypothetical protein